MNTIYIFTQEWHFNITAIIIAVILFIFHYISNGRKFTRKSKYFIGGIILLLLVTISPVDYLGHYYLFSAHMLQHVVILLIVPPLLLVGTDTGYLEKVMNYPLLKRTGNIVFYPVIAWILGVGSMWVWHIPSLIAVMKHSHALMILHMLSLLVLGIIFIWPVFTPIALHKLTPLQCSLYLFTACVGCTTLGILITFSPAGLFTSYLTGNQPEVINLIRLNWGITPGIDQEIGGLIMWVPACVIYVTNILITLGKWFNTLNEGEETPEKSVNSGIFASKLTKKF